MLQVSWRHIKTRRKTTNGRWQDEAAPCYSREDLAGLPLTAGRADALTGYSCLGPGDGFNER